LHNTHLSTLPKGISCECHSLYLRRSILRFNYRKLIIDLCSRV